MREPRTELAAAALNGRVYVIGGLGTRGNANEIYDPTENEWSLGADLPVFTHHPWAAAVAGRIYVGDGVTNRVFAYDPESDAWAEVASSTYRHGETPAVGVIDGRIYVAGGAGEEMVGNEVEVYEPSTDEWTVLAPMECARDHAAGGVIDGKLHVAGGRFEGDLNLTCHEVFDPVTNRWSPRADLPTGRSGIAGAAVDGRFYVFGGEINRDAPGRVFGVVEAYDPNSDAWTRMPSMPTARHGIFAAVIGNTIYLPGGARASILTGVNEAFIGGSGTR